MLCFVCIVLYILQCLRNPIHHTISAPTKLRYSFLAKQSKSSNSKRNPLRLARKHPPPQHDRKDGENSAYTFISHSTATMTMSRPSRTPSPNGVSKRSKPTTNLFERRLKKRPANPALAAKLSQMRLKLAPIVHAETGLAAPDYPSTMLSLFLLTEPQLDRLASYYSQSSPSHLTHAYPATMNWSHPFLDTDKTLPAACRLHQLERLKVKMRMFARFIGLRGAHTPVWEYERQVQIMGEKVRWRVRMEQGEEQRRKAFSRTAGWT